MHDPDNEYVLRQITLFCRKIEHYKTGQLTLNSLILDLSALSDAISRKSWTDLVSPIINHLEEINAIALVEGRNIGPDDKAEINRLLAALEASVRSFV